MSELEKNRLNASAPDYRKKIEQMGKDIRKRVETDLPHLSPDAKESVIRSRLGILSEGGTDTSKLVKVDLGENAGKKVKDSLF
ncbi:MAG: hypothetical protein SGJ18_03730 [Pseudomonadota bacterium]|nr:hypothetical protein [Pseudomonadota bacterium]